MKKSIALLGIILALLFYLTFTVAISTICIKVLNENLTEESRDEFLTNEIFPIARWMFLGQLSFFASTIILVASGYRSRWYFWCMLLLSVPAFIIIPGGSILATINACYLFIKRKEYQVYRLSNT